MRLPFDASGELRELAQLCGIQTFYLGADDEVREADPEVLTAVLGALGASVAQPKDVTSALRERRLMSARRLFEPIVVVRHGEPFGFRVTLSDRLDARSAWFTLRFEDGREQRTRLLADSSPVEEFNVEGENFARYHVKLSPEEAGATPLGYHRLDVEIVDDRHRTTSASALVVCAPRCPQAPRAWGLFMPLHALRSKEDWGVGSYGDLARLGEWVAENGGSMLGGLPLYPTFLDPPIDPSPYRPVSRLAYSELFIDPTALEELAHSRAALELLASADFAAQRRDARGSSLVDYVSVARLRRSVLEPLAETFLSTPSSRRDEFDAFFFERPELLAYAKFRAALERVGRAGVLQGGLDDLGDERSPSLDYHLYCQWAAHGQLRAAAKKVDLYADLPVGVHPQGFDPYWSPQSFMKAASAGAPPDLFYSEGQNWGFPPMHPEAIRDDGYQYFRAVLERALENASYLRIDHVMGLQRLYVVPEGFDARHGAYVSYHADEMHAIVCLEAERHGSVIVGEDLGTVPHEVRERMASDRMLRSWVFEVESTLESPLPEIPEGALATLATHDMARFSAFLWGGDLDEAEKAGRYSPEEADERRAARALYREALFRALEIPVLSPEELTSATRLGCEAYLASSAARLVLVDLEELFGESEPQNRPGTTQGNWRQRGLRTLEEATSDPNLKRALARIDELRKGQSR